MENSSSEKLGSEAIRKHITSTYTSLRIVLVVIAFTFPVVLYFGGRFLGVDHLLGSMSAYYHTGMRNFFVGFLFAIGACLYSYKGFTPKENYALNLAAIFAIGVAIFPMNCPPKIVCQTFTASKAHGICALLAFAGIAFVCWFCASDTLSEMKDLQRANLFRKTYKTLAFLMLASPLIALALTYTVQFERAENSYVYFAELVAMWVFGYYWLVKSREIALTNAEEKAALRQLELPAAATDVKQKAVVNELELPPVG